MAPAICGVTLKRPGRRTSTSVSRSSIITSVTSPSARSKPGLAAGADIVITGRCADSALALGVLMHEFGWAADDYDKLAAGSLVGHVLECGPQATGGNHTDWQDVQGWDDIGYPLAECRADGSFVLAKPEGTGGLITPGVAAEQIPDGLRTLAQAVGRERVAPPDAMIGG